MNNSQSSQTAKTDLLLAVVRQAYEDLKSDNEAQRHDAARFFQSDWYQRIHETLLLTHQPGRHISA